MRIQASWSSETTVLESRDALEAIIARVRETATPTMIFLEAETGATFVFGIGRDESVLTFVERDGASFHSVGDTTRVDILRFLCRDQVDDFMGQMAIPEAIAVEAAREFSATGGRPVGVRWESDWESD